MSRHFYQFLLVLVSLVSCHLLVPTMVHARIIGQQLQWEESVLVTFDPESRKKVGRARD